jgi:hypothetical protein
MTDTREQKRSRSNACKIFSGKPRKSQPTIRSYLQGARDYQPDASADNTFVIILAQLDCSNRAVDFRANRRQAGISVEQPRYFPLPFAVTSAAPFLRHIRRARPPDCSVRDATRLLAPERVVHHRRARYRGLAAAQRVKTKMSAPTAVET